MIVDKILKFIDENDLKIDEEIVKEFGKLSANSLRRQFTEQEDTSKGKLRLSGCGKCARKLAYGYHGVPQNGKDIDARGRMTFLFGDIVESIVVSLAKMSGCMLVATGGDQLTIKLKVGDKEVFGHPDGVLWHENEWVLFECKSMSTFRYADFEKGVIDEDYIAQMNAYMHALGLNKCVIVALNKDNSVIGERLIQKDDKVVEYLLNNINIVLQSKEDALPDRKYSSDDKGFYPWQCLYCSYYKTCLPNAEEVLVSKRYKLKEKKDGHTQSS